MEKSGFAKGTLKPQEVGRERERERTLHFYYYPSQRKRDDDLLSVLYIKAELPLCFIHPNSLYLRLLLSVFDCSLRFK